MSRLGITYFRKVLMTMTPWLVWIRSHCLRYRAREALCSGIPSGHLLFFSTSKDYTGMENTVIGQDRFECGEACRGRKFEVSVRDPIHSLAEHCSPTAAELRFRAPHTGTHSSSTMPADILSFSNEKYSHKLNLQTKSLNYYTNY